MPERATSSLYRHLRRVVVPTAVFSLAINVLLFTTPLYMLQIYDRVMSSRSVPTLVALTMIAGYLVAISTVLEFLRQRVLVRTGRDFESETRPLIAARVLELRATNPAASASLMADADCVREFVTGAGFLAFLDAPWAPLFIGVCFLLHPVIGIVALGGSLLLFGLAVASDRATRAGIAKAAVASSREKSQLRSAAAAHEVLKANGMADAAIAQWSRSREAFTSLQNTTSDRAGLYVTLTRFVRVGLQIAILGTGAYLAIHDAVSGGIVYAASLMMGRALSPVEQAVAQYRSFLGARQAYARLRAAFDVAPKEPSIALPTPTTSLTVDAATVVYGGNAVLKRVSLSILAGEVVAVIGDSGSGKSTLLRLMTGALTPTDGNVRFDGHKAAEYDPEILGRAIGYLPQTIDLLDGTIAENIGRLAAPEWLASEEGSLRVLAAASASGVTDLVAKLPDGYETKIGEDGMRLSGGQRQRIGLARAFFGSPRFLILDEPSAALDRAAETALAEAIAKAKANGAAVVFSTHRFLCAAVTRVVVVRDGAIAADGPRDEVLTTLSQGSARLKVAN